MYKIDRPAPSAAEVYQAAVLSMRNAKKRADYIRCAPDVEAQCAVYDQLGLAGTFEEANPKDFEIKALEVTAMRDLYDKQFNNVKSTGHFRDEILLGATNARCPYCGLGQVSQLDHYLPKSEFQAITVHPQNLVPACADCNKIKSAYRPTGDAPAVLHPYFDEAFDWDWLEASLVIGEGEFTVAEFGVSTLISDSQLVDRLSTHLGVFNLCNRFSSEASQVLQGFERVVKTAGEAWKLEYARNHLQSSLETAAYMGPNDCRAATFSAMLKTEWYLTGHLQLK